MEATVRQCAVALESMLIEPVIAPMFSGAGAVAQYEAGAFALEIAKQLAVRS